MTPIRLCTVPLLIGLFLVAAPALAAEPAVLVIGHAALPRLDTTTVARLYTGRAIEVGGTAVTVINAVPGSALRQRFLAAVLQQDEDKYGAYWTVRRHVGKGVPPRELGSSAELIQFVQSTPGAVGYIDAAELRPGMNVLARP